MTVRAGMADLITALRLLIGDPMGAAEVFADQELQDALDLRRAEVNECALAWRPQTAQGGTVTYHDYYAPRGRWEADPTLKDRSYGVLTPDTADLLTGHWTFVANVVPPVFITGYTYDLHGAAYDVLNQWAAKVTLDFDFATDGQQFARSQKRAGLIAQALEYSRRALPSLRAIWRADVGEW